MNKLAYSEVMLLKLIEAEWRKYASVNYVNLIVSHQ